MYPTGKVNNMNLKQTTFSLVHTHLGDVSASEYNIYMADKTLITNMDIIKESERFFKSKLVGLDQLEIHQYIEVDYNDVDIQTWVNKVGFSVLPKIMRIQNEKR